MEYAVIINAVNIATQEEKKFYFSGGKGFTSSPSSVPANTFFNPRLASPYTARRDLFDKSTTYGVISNGGGSISLQNIDGHIDEIVIDYAINGREIEIYTTDIVQGDGSPSKQFPDDYVLVHRAIANKAVANDKEVIIELSDKVKILDNPLLQNKYLGNNSLPSGTEGLEDDLKGRRKPRLYGKVFNIAPYYVNTSRLIYQVSDKPCTVSAVYSRGIAWASEGNYAAFADLQNDALEPNQSKYKVYSGVEGTFFRLGSIPNGTLTCDAETTEKNASELIKQVALDAGLLSTELSTSDFTAMSAIAYQCGIWVTEDRTALDVITELASAIGAYVSFDYQGVLRIGRLEVPSVESISFYKDQYMTFSLESTSDTDEGIPAKKLTLNYARNYTVQEDLDGTAATTERVSFSKLEYRKVVKENSLSSTLYKDAPEIEISTCLIDNSDAVLECERRLDQLQQRRLHVISVGVNREVFDSVDINSGVKLYHDRFGLENGKIFCCIGITYNFLINEMTLRLWG